jgi:membrane protease YdiL (CAAX protease family)
MILIHLPVTPQLLKSPFHNNMGLPLLHNLAFGYYSLPMAQKLRGYLRETRRPIYSAALVLPFLVVYHIGTIVLQTTYINGADALIVRILRSFSVHSMFGSVLVLAACFIIWQLRTRESWNINAGMLFVYFLESVCFALLLLFAFGWLSTRFSLILGEIRQSFSDLVLYCGAGVYEELVFRAFLLSILIAAFKFVFKNNKRAALVKRPALISAVLLGALIFSAFHYIGPSGDAFSLGSFAQRILAGVYFSTLFVTRGFGVTAASHALYDIFIGLIPA